MAVENGHTMFHLGGDGVGYLLILLGEDKELYALSAGIHGKVEREALDTHGTETEYRLVYAGGHIAELRIEKTARDDKHIDEREHLAQ